LKLAPEDIIFKTDAQHPSNFDIEKGHNKKHTFTTVIFPSASPTENKKRALNQKNILHFRSS
jgi:hypothetical protein